mmetsp:Transcript_39632/g.100677  ORF Transcript_39632/g.100677 Transcript_39632/m.100677 type:complete len:336 (+) Transcript_39632:127-1134(+)
MPQKDRNALARRAQTQGIRHRPENIGCRGIVRNDRTTLGDRNPKLERKRSSNKSTLNRPQVADSNLIETRAYLGREGICRLLRVTQQHVSVLLVEDGIVEVSIAAGHGALHEDDLLGPPDLDDGHAPNRTTLDLLRRGIHHVVCADDKHHVVVLHTRIDLIHLKDPLVWHSCLGQEHVHLTGHAAGDGVDPELQIDIVASEQAGNLAHGSLCTRHGHAVARDHQYLSGIDKQLRHGINARLGVLLWATVRTRRHRCIVHSPEEHVEDIAVHSVAHDLCEDGSAEADERAHDRKDGALQQEALGHQGPTRIGVQDCDADGHVTSTDAAHEVDAHRA